MERAWYPESGYQNHTLFSRNRWDAPFRSSPWIRGKTIEMTPDQKAASDYIQWHGITYQKYWEYAISLGYSEPSANTAVNRQMAKSHKKDLTFSGNSLSSEP
jgi:hypothetical protein